MEISQTTGTGLHSSSAASLAAASGGNTLGKDAFLNLLITQMRYQDPLSPLDNQAFVAQMAQFSALEQMQNLNDKLGAEVMLSSSLNNSTATSLIGRQVRTTGNSLELGESGPVEMGYFLTSEAASATVTIYDESGALVRTYTESDLASGSHLMEWDGRDGNGQRVAPGNYTFEVSAVDGEGASVEAITVVNGLVEGVTYRNGSAYLIVDGQEVPFSGLLEVRS